MKLLKSLLIAIVLFVSLAHKPAQASSRETANLAVSIVAAAALLSIAVDLAEYNDPYWRYRDSHGCYYRPITTEQERTTCSRNRGYYYHNGYNYQCVTVTTYHEDYIRHCY